MPANNSQISLFGGPVSPGPAPAPLDPALHRLGAALPPLLRFGTSSWGYSGWKDLVYDRASTDQALAREGLGAYAAHPLLRAVGVDRSHYQPPKTEVFADYAAAVPGHFRFLVKAHDHCTLAAFPRHPRYGERAGAANPRFLDPAYAAEAVVGPFAVGLGAKAGPLLFQFAPQPLSLLSSRHGAAGFADRLHAFLRGLPRGPCYAVEVRNRDLITPQFAAALADLRACPCPVVWPGMPPLEEQAATLGVDRAPALVLRWMLRPGDSHEAAGARFSPFDRLAEPDDAQRDAVARLAVAAVARRRPALIIVNNNAEGCAPLSIQRVARAAQALGGWGGPDAA